MTQIEEEFIKAFYIPEDEYTIDSEGELHFKSDYTLVKCNIFGMGWILGRQHDIKHFPPVLMNTSEGKYNV